MNAPARIPARREARLLAAFDPLPLITTQVRMPNREWLAFLDGPLSRDDWALIERVERGEISVDEAMAKQGRAL